MQDLVYTRNVLAERGCPVCGTDRRGRRVRKARACAACGAPLVAGEAFARVAASGASLACSIACLKALPAAVEPASVTACGWCDARWPADAIPPRACLSCGDALSADVGYVAILRSGRARTFCDAACLLEHLARPNAFCG